MLHDHAFAQHLPFVHLEQTRVDLGPGFARGGEVVEEGLQRNSSRGEEWRRKVRRRKRKGGRKGKTGRFSTTKNEEIPERREKERYKRLTECSYQFPLLILPIL